MIAIGLAPAACATSFAPPSESLMTDCPEPQLVADPETATHTEINVERVEVAKWGKCNETKFHGLRDFIRGMDAN